MKTCPICESTCFDDMEVCFGCMHRFDDAATEHGPAPAPGQGSDLRQAARALVPESAVPLPASERPTAKADADEGAGGDASRACPGYRIVLSLVPATRQDQGIPLVVV